MLLIFATPEEARVLLGLSTRQTEILRPQTSGPCVHYDDKHPDEPCTYPYGDEYSDGVCPHLDNPEILCPVKDACYAMRDVARMRGVCEAEQEGGQCEYYDERSDVEPCTYPYEWGCPHLDDPAIICPGKDERSAETERIEQDLAWAGGDDLPEFVSLAQDPEGWGRDMAADPADQVPRSDYVLAPPAADTGARVPEFEPADDPDVDMESAHTGRLHTYEVNPEPEIPGPAPEEEPVYEVASTRKTAWSHAEDAAMYICGTTATQCPPRKTCQIQRRCR